MLRSYTSRAARSFATAKAPVFLSDAVAKAAIGKDLEVATSFVSAFAPVVHRQGVCIGSVSSLPEATGLSLARDMKHDIALRYSVGDIGSAVLEVVPQHYSRALVEIQQQPERYLPARALAHASGHYLAAINEEAKLVKQEKQKAKEEEQLAARAANSAAKEPAAGRKPRSKEFRVKYDSAFYTAYMRVEPVHVLMLCDFSYAHDAAAKVWRSPKSAAALDGKKYGWAAPLFSTFRLTTDAGNVRLSTGLEDPGLTSFAASLRDRLSITTVHLPLVPSSLDNDRAWEEVVTLPEHKEALKSTLLRQWLHYLAHSQVEDGKVQMPAELKVLSIFRKSAEMAESVLRAEGGFSFSEKEMTDFALQAERDKEEAAAAAREEERTAAAAVLEQERAAAAAALEQERAAAAAALEQERAAAAAARAAAAEREQALRAELERLTSSGSGAR
jgi:hypothetical protein